MAAATGTYRKGRIVLNEPVDWPEGTEVKVTTTPAEMVGLTEAEWPTTPEGIAEWLKWLHSYEPVEMTAAEEAEWQAARAASKRYAIEKMSKTWEEDE